MTYTKPNYVLLLQATIPEKLFLSIDLWVDWEEASASCVSYPPWTIGSLMYITYKGSIMSIAKVGHMDKSKGLG
jgi:hypothetical protein